MAALRPRCRTTTGAAAALGLERLPEGDHRCSSPENRVSTGAIPRIVVSSARHAHIGMGRRFRTKHQFVPLAHCVSIHPGTANGRQPSRQRRFPPTARDRCRGSGAIVTPDAPKPGRRTPGTQPQAKHTTAPPPGAGPARDRTDVETPPASAVAEHPPGTDLATCGAQREAPTSAVRRCRGRVSSFRRWSCRSQPSAAGLAQRRQTRSRHPAWRSLLCGRGDRRAPALRRSKRQQRHKGFRAAPPQRRRRHRRSNRAGAECLRAVLAGSPLHRRRSRGRWPRVH